jgi:hypothetical protein
MVHSPGKGEQDICKVWLLPIILINIQYPMLFFLFPTHNNTAIHTYHPSSACKWTFSRKSKVIPHLYLLQRKSCFCCSVRTWHIHWFWNIKNVSFCTTSSLYGTIHYYISQYMKIYKAGLCNNSNNNSLEICPSAYAYIAGYQIFTLSFAITCLMFLAYYKIVIFIIVIAQKSDNNRPNSCIMYNLSHHISSIPKIQHEM